MRAARKEVARLERALEKLSERETRAARGDGRRATDHVRLRELQADLAENAAEQENLELEWLEAAEQAG